MCENIGNIADAYSNGNLPKCGMIISATRDELLDVVKPKKRVLRKAGTEARQPEESKVRQ